MATQLRLRHGLLRNLVVSLAELKLQDRSQWFAWRRHCCTVAQVYLRGCMHIFCGERGVYPTGVLGTSACRCVHSTGVVDISVHISDAMTAGCAHALVCSQFVHLRWGTSVGVFD